VEPRLLDTDVFSFFFKGDSRRQLYEADIRGHELCLCFQTVAEVKLWARLRQWGTARTQRLDAVLRHYIVLPYDAKMVETWAEISAHRRALGRPIGCGDCWVAAAAVRHPIPLITHNLTDYQDIPGLTLITHAHDTRS